MFARRIFPLCIFSFLGFLVVMLTGCALSSGSPAGSRTSSTGSGSSTARVALGGEVYGGQQPITGAALTLWAAGKTGSYGTGAMPVATTTTDSNGNFSFNNTGMSPCTTGQYLYITAVGGNPGAGTNQFAAEMAALPTPCGPGTASSYVVVNEVTTVASVTALQQFMSIMPGGTPAWTIGAPVANVTGMANAFTQVGNLVNIGTGTSSPTTATSTINSVTYTTTITPDSTKINTLADILAACINTAGSSTCNSIFADTTPGSSASPTDTIQAMYYLATNAGALNLPAHSASQGEPYYLCTTYIPGTGTPFQPYSTCSSTVYPTDWAIGVSWSTSNGSIIVGTATPFSLAIDGPGNIWTAYSCSGSTACTDTLNDHDTGPAYVTEFNPQGQVQFTPATSTTISTGPSFSTYTGSTVYSLIAGRPFSLAIDTANNAWFDSFYGAAPATQRGVITKFAQGGTSTGYLVAGSSVGTMAIDGNNDILLSSQPTSGHYSFTELEYDGGAYSTYNGGIGKSTSIYNGIWADSSGYAWTANSGCANTIFRANTANLEAGATTSDVTNATACPNYAGAADAAGGAFYANSSLYHVAVSGGSGLYTGVVATEAAGTGTSNGGLDGGSGVAVDGLGNVWVANNSGGGVSEFSYNGSTFTPLSPSGTSTPVYGFGTSYLSGTHPLNVAVDASGNVWIGTQTTNLWYLVGIAGPTVTPISAMLKNGQVGARPGFVIQASLGPAALGFSTAVSLGETLTATLTNTGGAIVNVGVPATSGANQSDFAMTGNTCGSVVAVGASCSISVTFTSGTPGSFSAVLNVPNNATGNSASVALTGAAATSVGTLSLDAGTSVASSAPSVTFPAILVGTVTAPEAVILTNTGSVPLSLGIATTGTNANLFSQTNDCASPLAAGASCAISVTFGSTVGGGYSAMLALTDNAGSGSQAISLSGTANYPASAVQLSATSLSLSTAAGTTTATVPVTITNTGSASLTLTGIGLTGTNASSFSESSSCTGSLAQNASCSVSISFSPAAIGAYTAALSIADDASGSPQIVALSGTAPTNPAPQISVATSLSLTQPAYSTGPPQIVTVTNSGSAPLTVSGITLTGTDAADFTQTSTCGTSLAPDGTCNVSVTLAAYLARSYSAALQIATNDPNSPSTVTLNGTGTGTLSINTTNPTQWIISNGAITLQWDSTNATANVYSINLAGDSTQLIDTTVSFNGGEPYGLYEDDSGPTTGGPATATYTQVGNEYLDWWQTSVSDPTANQNFTVTRHYIVTANDPGFHVYNTTAHGTADIATGLGTLGKTFRINQQLFTNSYSVDEDLTDLGVQALPLPSTATMAIAGADPGRAVENAVSDLHGLALPSGFTRFFDTKYDYSTSAYLHKAHGLYGSKYGAWLVLPNGEWRPGGPTKQSLCFTYNILSQEFFTSHLDNGITYNMAAGQVFSKLWGPNYYHFNTFNSTITTPDQMYADAQAWLPWFNELYDNESQLIGSGQVASTQRGSLQTAIVNGGSVEPYTAWTVLSDNATNFQYSAYGRDYWVNQNSTGTAVLSGIVPGTYRLSSYVLGQWGELRQDNVVVNANQTANVSGVFTPESFGTAAPIWTIGTPNRSASEYLHGTDSNGNSYRANLGTYNFWLDFASTLGTQVYYATAVGATPASNNLNLINYNQWGTFDPGLFAGIYNAADDTTDGYNYVIPSYVATLPGATGTLGISTPVPPLTIHFTTTADQQAQGQYTVVSVAVACAESDIFANLNGQKQLIWHSTNVSDCMMRSSFTGYYQWIAFQWPTSYLNAPGTDNVLTLSANNNWGDSWDAFRMEVTNQSANPATTGWNDYEFVTGGSNIRANDLVPNN